jgi:hypothetical protein
MGEFIRSVNAVPRLIRKSTRRAISRYWGYLLLPVLYWAWFVGELGYGPLTILSTVAGAFFLFQAKVPCCAANRDGTFCRNNAHGLLGGCHIAQHRWQNLKMLIRQSSWGRLAHGLFRRVSGGAATLSAVGSVASALIAAGALLVATLTYVAPRAPPMP